MKIKAMLTGVLFLISSSNVVAQQSTAFSAAADEWLNGPEISSLEAMRVLAKAGDVSAQLLLGQIDRDTPPGGFSTYLANLDPAERSELLRSDVDQGTKNWLLNLTDPDFEQMGKAIFGYRLSRDRMGDAVAIQKQNEFAAAEYIVWETMMGGRFDMVNAMPVDNGGLSNAGFLQWISAYVSGSNKALTMNRLLKDTSSDKIAGLLTVKRLSRVLGFNRHFSDEINQFITILKGQGYDLPEDSNLVKLNADFSEIAEIDLALSLVTRSCDKCAGDSIDYECVIQSLEIVGGYNTLMTIRTPVENAISAEAFLKSDRALAIFENILNSRSNYYPRPIRSTCVADFLAQNKH